MTVLTVVYRRKDSFVECVLHTHACTHTHMRARVFNCPFSRTIRGRRYQNGKTNLDFTEAREWQWHQPGYIQVCTSLQTDNHTSS